jgi:hypothetical protein
MVATYLGANVMAQTPRGKAFDEKEPTLTKEEMARALKAGNTVVSFKGQPVVCANYAIVWLAVKFALSNGDHPILLIDHFGAQLLMTLFEAANQVNWNAKMFRGSSTEH